jgi:phosphoglycerol transferase MdoB-like AlkP superfamily enzyme
MPLEPNNRKTHSVFFHFLLFFIFLSLAVRTGLLFIVRTKLDLSLTELLRIYGLGLLFDLGVACFFLVPYAVYLNLMPLKWQRANLGRALTYSVFSLVVMICMFSFFAEFTFWGEFESRFNFIAVDYLVYTYEVVKNIHESYPLPLLISAMLGLTFLVVWIFRKRGYFQESFNGHTGLGTRTLITILTLGTAFLYATGISSNLAEKGKNRFHDELAKAGIYSFFSAFRNNELDYDNFYKRIDNSESLSMVRADLSQPHVRFISDTAVTRVIENGPDTSRPNVIMVTIESLSADFLGIFGNRENLTPNLDSISRSSILFTNLYATGTRTVRGMEALSLAIPPTPGSSIVRRPDNEHLATIGSIFQQKGYKTAFFYGGDGYFDNMNHYFGNNGYEIHDHGRESLMMTDHLEANRKRILDRDVHFQNAWGICDEDIYDAVIQDADEQFASGQKFYDFVMTTSNHRPYTYPAGKIDIPSGSGRAGAVKYTDYAIGRFLNKAAQKPWFPQTIFMFVADHCASSAGKNEIDISKYHIPAMIYGSRAPRPMVISKPCSQIDLYPTLFSMLGWRYKSTLFGKDVLDSNYVPRYFVGTYQKLGYVEKDSLVILSPQQKVDTYLYKADDNQQTASPLSGNMVNKAIAHYQEAYYLFKHHGLKQ